MDIYNYLKKDHRLVADMMEAVVKSDDKAKQKALFEQIKMELTLHADTEEVTFYAEIDKKSRSEAVHEKLEHADDEHDEIRSYLAKLTNMPIDAKWMEMFGEFKHSVTHHVEEEEGEIFEKAKKYLSHEDAVRLAKEMEELKREAKKQLAAA